MDGTEEGIFKLSDNLTVPCKFFLQIILKIVVKSSEVEEVLLSFSPQGRESNLYYFFLVPVLIQTFKLKRFRFRFLIFFLGSDSDSLILVPG